MTNRSEMNKRANVIMKKWCIKNDVTTCENCDSSYWLTYAHRHKRRHYRTLEELTDPKQFLLLCMDCHQDIEYDPIKTEQLFIKLRDDQKSRNY